MLEFLFKFLFLEGFRPATLLKTDSKIGCFSVKFYRTPFLTEHLQWSSFKWRVTVSGELMLLESYGNCDVTNTVILLL